MRRRYVRRRLTRNQKLTASAVTAGLLLAALHTHTPPPGTPTGGGGNEALANAIATAAPYYWAGSEATCLDELWIRESGFRAAALNPQSGAYGIPQALPASKMAAAGPGLADQSGHPDPLGAGLHRLRVRHAVRRVGARDVGRLVLAGREWRTPVITRELVTLLIIGGGVVVLIQFTGLRFWQAAACFVAGYYLASSAVGPQVGHLLSRIPGLFGGTARQPGKEKHEEPHLIRLPEAVPGNVLVPVGCRGRLGGRRGADVLGGYRPARRPGQKRR